jgi:uncharacterized DUF497 family protein
MVSQFLRLKKCLVANRSFAEFAKGRTKNQDVYSALGQTYDGRYLIVFHIQKGGGMVLPISARDMNLAERKYYEKHR